MSNFANLQNGIYIPRIFDYILLDELKTILETTDGGIGSIYKIEFIPKENKKDGQFYSAFVYFESFYETCFAHFLQNMFQQKKQIKLYYDNNKYTTENPYMILMQNTYYINEEINPNVKIWSNNETTAFHTSCGWIEYYEEHECSVNSDIHEKINNFVDELVEKYEEDHSCTKFEFVDELVKDEMEEYNRDDDYRDDFKFLDDFVIM